MSVNKIINPVYELTRVHCIFLQPVFIIHLLSTMASTAEEVPVPADQPPQDEGHEAANTSSEAAKPRFLKRPVKPDAAEYKKQMDALVEQIKRHRDRSDEISRILSGKRTGSDTPETKALRTKLSTLRAEWQTTLVRV